MGFFETRGPILDFLVWVIFTKSKLYCSPSFSKIDFFFCFRCKIVVKITWYTVYINLLHRKTRIVIMLLKNIDKIWFCKNCSFLLLPGRHRTPLETSDPVGGFEPPPYGSYVQKKNCVVSTGNFELVYRIFQ